MARGRHFHNLLECGSRETNRLLCALWICNRAGGGKDKAATFRVKHVMTNSCRFAIAELIIKARRKA